MNGLGRFDVIIAGAGAAGLWTAYELVRAGARVLLIHAPHEHGYSSTRNQGWLHSGALYAVFDAPAVTRDCAKGSQRIRDWANRHDPSLLSPTEFCYMFDSAQLADDAVNACHEAGIAARSRRTHPQVQGLFGRLAWSVTVPDASIDTSGLLRVIGRQLSSAGLSVAAAESLYDLRLLAAGNGWDVSGPEFSASGASVVLAAGTLIPRLLASACLPDQLTARLEYEVTETTVLGVPGLRLPAAVVCTGGGPHLIPYGSAGLAGMTICVPFDNQPAEPASVHLPPAAPARERVLANVAACMPGLAAELAVTERKFWYSCQKLIPAGARSRPDWRHNVFASAAPGLYVAYAGKFTTAPVLAELITRQLDRGWHGGSASAGSDEIEIADQPFRAQSVASNGR